MPETCAFLSCDANDLWLCMICFDCFCGSRDSGHMYSHSLSEDHRIALCLNKKQFWCFSCLTPQVTSTEDSRFQIAFGLCMSPRPDSVEIGHLLRRLHRRGKPNPGSWSELPPHKRSVFECRESVSLHGLASRWSETIQGLNSVNPVGLKVVVLAGAGISCKAGIPDFRSPVTGLYSNLNSYAFNRPEDMFTLSFFEKNPYPFYRFAKSIWPTGQYKPTKTHYFIRLLELKNLLLRVYTQNIDGLESLANISPEKIVEAHGSFKSASCMKCGGQADIETLRNDIFEGDVPVYCEACGETGLVKPDITFFGEMLPARYQNLNARDFEECDLLIIIGTSLKVSPFNSLPSAVEDTVPRLLINRECVTGTGFEPMTFEGPCAYRDIYCGGDCDENIEILVSAMGWEQELADLWEKGNKVDMKKPLRPSAISVPHDEHASVVKTTLPSIQRLPAPTREIAEERALARMDIQAAMFNSDKEKLRDAIHRGKELGLSYWELAAAQEILES